MKEKIPTSFRTEGGKVYGRKDSGWWAKTGNKKQKEAVDRHFFQKQDQIG
jgi:hypothetical protein